MNAASLYGVEVHEVPLTYLPKQRWGRGKRNRYQRREVQRALGYKLAAFKFFGGKLIVAKEDTKS